MQKLLLIVSIVKSINQVPEGWYASVPKGSAKVVQEWSHDNV